jgi:hypothetical protein
MTMGRLLRSRLFLPKLDRAGLGQIAKVHMGERGFMELDFDKYKAQQFCDHLDCEAYGKIGGNTIKTHSRRHHQVYCHACNPIWVMTKGTFFYNLKAPVSLILEVLKW